MTGPMAVEILDTHYALGEETNQRSLFTPKVNQFYRDMISGKWDEESHQGLGIAKNGAVLDGLTRLHALAKAAQKIPNIAIEMAVSTGMNKRTMDVIDIGRPRSLELVLRLSHSIPDGRVLASSIRVMMTVGNRRLANVLSPPQAVEVLDLVGEPIRKVVNTLGWKKPSSYIVGPVAFYATSKPRKAIEFAESLRDLADLPKGSPVLHLKKHLEKMKMRWHEVFNLSQATCSALRRFDQGIISADPLELGPEQWDWLESMNPELMKKIMRIASNNPPNNGK